MKVTKLNKAEISVRFKTYIYIYIYYIYVICYIYMYIYKQIRLKEAN